MVNYDFHYEFLGRPKILPTPESSAPTSPVTGMYLWYDASDDPTLTYDGSNNVTAWADKSGNVINLTSTGAAAPKRTVNYKAGKTYVVADSVSISHMTTAAQTNYTGDVVTIYTVIVPQVSTGTSTRRIFSMSESGQSDATNSLHMSMGKNATATQLNARKGATSGAAQYTITDGTPYVYAVQRTSTPQIIGWLNDIGNQSTPVSDLTNFQTSMYRLFNTQLSPTIGTQWIGAIGEVLVYLSQHNSTDVDNNIRYLRNKWGF